MDQLTISCDDCARARGRLEEAGFRVADCSPAPGRAGSCLISFEHSPPAAAAAARSAASGLTASQISAAQAIVNIFETGDVQGLYGQVTLIPGDTGHLTYGRSQTTLGSGNLHTLVQRYCANPGARFGTRLQAYLPRLEAIDVALDNDKLLANLLRAAADDRVMREVQDAFFDDIYWRPALRNAERAGIRTPLGVAVVYDSKIHGSWERMRDKVNADLGAAAQVGEQAWINAYLAARRAWLANSPRSDLRATVYRMDALLRLVDQGLWGLTPPLVVRGKEISANALAAPPPGCYDGPQPGTRPLALAEPLNRGLDVRLVQLGLSERGMSIQADGVYGQASFKCVKAFEAAHGLPATGVADIGLISMLVN